jgi:predicted nuclease with TOPRIM domain
MKNNILAHLLSAPSPERTKGRLTSARVPWLPALLAGTAVVIFLFSPGPQRILSPLVSMQKSVAPAREYNQAFQADSSSGLRANESSSLGSSLSRIFSPESQPAEVPITDNREFLKTGYNATIKTRHTQELAGRLQTTVRGFGGRVDGAVSSPLSGFVRFVVPADKFEAFRGETKNLAGERFYAEQISSENLLPQKQSIEQQQKDAEQNLSALKANRDGLIAGHNSNVEILQSQIAGATQQLAAAQAEAANRPERKAELEPRIRQLQGQFNALKAQLNTENTNYVSQLNSLDTQMQEATKKIELIKNQDQALLDNVATISGTIALSHINWWSFLTVYVPAYWLALLLLAAAIIVYWRQRRRTHILLS